MLRLLVFGKTGQVATALAKKYRYQAPKILVKCVGRNEVDITDRGSVEAAVALYQPNIIINAAAYTAVDRAEDEPEQAHQVNSLGAENVAIASAAHNLPTIHISTDYVFYGDKPEPYAECDRVNPCSIYGTSKLAGEVSVAKANPRHIILRTAWVYSETGQNFVKTMLRLGQEHDDVRVVSDQYGNPTSADEIATSILMIANHVLSHPEFSHWGVYHFCGPDSMSWADLAKRVFAVSSKLGGITANVVSITTAQYPTKAKRPANSILNDGKIRSVFGYRHQEFSQSLNSVVKRILDK